MPKRGEPNLPTELPQMSRENAAGGGTRQSLRQSIFRLGRRRKPAQFDRSAYRRQYTDGSYASPGIELRASGMPGVNHHATPPGRAAHL